MIKLIINKNVDDNKTNSLSLGNAFQGHIYKIIANEVTPADHFPHQFALKIKSLLFKK